MNKKFGLACNKFIVANRMVPHLGKWGGYNPDIYIPGPLSDPPEPEPEPTGGK
jgi:hypothetical protein